MQQYIAAFIYYTIVLLIPLKETYISFKNQDTDNQTLSLWGNYWAVFSIIQYVQHWIGFFTYQPFTFVFMLVLLWCYHSQYKGALYISKNVKHLISSNPAIVNVVNMLNQKAKFFNLFESEPAISQSKAKTQ